MKTTTRRTGCVLFATITLFSTAALGQNYVSLRGGMISDDSSGSDSQLYSLTLSLGRQQPQYDASVSAQYLQSEANSSSTSGMGDLYVRVGKLLRDEYRDGANLYGSLAAKIPTADENKGLGTGEADYSAYLSLGKTLGTIKWDIHGGYTLLGDPPGVDYDDQINYGIGLFRGFINTGLFASWENSRSANRGRNSATSSELHLGAMRWFGLDNLLGLNGFVGLDNNSADYGVNLEWIHLY